MNRRTLLRLAAASTLLAGLLSTPFAQADALADIKKHGVLRVAVPLDFPPFGSVGTDMNPHGYDIDVATLIAKDLGVKLALVPVTSTNRVPFLTTGKVDLIISSLGKNPDREKVIDFSAPYAPFFNGVFGPTGVAIAGAKDLTGKTVAVTRGSVEDLELTKIAPAGTTIKRFEDNNTTVAAYFSGQTELLATGNVVATSLKEHIKKRPLETKFLIKNSPCYIGLNKNETALQAKLNEILASAKKSGELNQISERWLNAPLPASL
jgi:polar amino acid transport system substrate-binding protein